MQNLSTGKSSGKEIAAVASFSDDVGVWNAAHDWLATCKRLHSPCSEVLVPPALPTRLIDVGSSGIESARLCLSETLGLDTEYLTLSHSWGTQIFETLKQDNKKDFMIRIPPSALSKTFEDAIVATRRLGFRYIWIDSLCIVQDDPEDVSQKISFLSETCYLCYGN